MYAKTDNANLKKDLSSIELPAKLLNWFSRINKSNINQSIHANVVEGVCRVRVSLFLTLFVPRACVPP